MATNPPVTVHPLFSPSAAAASLTILLFTTATALATLFTPLSHLMKPQLAHDIVDTSIITAAILGPHLAWARSLSKTVDGRQYP